VAGFLTRTDKALAIVSLSVLTEPDFINVLEQFCMMEEFDTMTQYIDWDLL